VEKYLVHQPENMQALRLAYSAARADGRMEEAAKYSKRMGVTE
jgi:hypothetical protein